MDAKQQSLQELQQIKQMMERSSKFISLSGLSGISAGVCALIATWLASDRINCLVKGRCDTASVINKTASQLKNEIVLIAIITFAVAFATSFLFTYLRSKKTTIPLWGNVAYRLFWNVAIPLLAGGIFLLRSMDLGHYELIAPGCLIFYGLALVNASKYTLGEVRYLGYGQILLGIANLWLIGYGLYFWAAGFGVLHILYGIVMWNQYERSDRNKVENE
jgi:hypothetical protein